MTSIKIWPKQSEREWFLSRFSGSFLNFSDAVNNGLKLYTYNKDALLAKYDGKIVRFELQENVDSFFGNVDKQAR